VKTSQTTRRTDLSTKPSFGILHAFLLNPSDSLRLTAFHYLDDKFGFITFIERSNEMACAAQKYPCALFLRGMSVRRSANLERLCGVAQVMKNFITEK